MNDHAALHMCTHSPLAALLLGLLTLWSGSADGREPRAADGTLRALRFTGGTFFGPGHMADTPSPGGELTHLAISPQLEGRIELFNNGAAAPNIASEAAQGGADGRISNGRAFNEYMDGGIVPVGQGAMSFLNVTVADGPGQGIARTFLDPDLNWHLVVDLALDPGFPEGLIVIDQLDITSGIAHVPRSLQTASRQPGGIDRAGSLNSGRAVVGRVGDFDNDGKLDGVMVGVTNIPLAHILLPGAPAVQVRGFVTDVPIARLDAALLESVSARNLAQVLATEQGVSADPAVVESGWPELARRLDATMTSLGKDPRAARVRGTIERLSVQAHECASANAASAACAQLATRARAELTQATAALAELASLHVSARRQAGR